MSAPLPSPSPLPPWLERRPTKRSECPPPDQQCPWVSCRYHLAFDFKKMRPRDSKQPPPKFLFSALPEDPELWPADAPTCALHVAEGGAHILEEVGSLLHLTRERVRQIENQAKSKLKKLGITSDLAEAFDLDTSTPPPRNLRPSANSKGHHMSEWRPRSTDPELDGTYSGPFRSQDMTAKMRKIQAECAAPCRTLSPDDIDLVALAADIDRKRAGKPAPLGQRRPLVTLDNFSQRRDISRQKAGAATASTTRINAPAKADTTTTPRPPSPPSTASLETPPQDPPTTIQSDDQPEVAVVPALPDPPSPPPQQPMTRPDMRTRRSVYEDANETAKRNLAKIMASRGITRESLSAMARTAHTAHTPMSVDQAIVRALNGTASPVSVWYRRIATLLNIPLSDLCDDPAWLSAVAPEDSPAASPHTPPILPQHPPSIPLPTHEDALAPLILAALTQAQRLDKRVAELAAVTTTLRDEIDSLQQQLAERTRERDAATSTLARIKAAL